MDNYKKRVADGILAEKLAGKGAVLIEGAKWCGKNGLECDMVVNLRDGRCGLVEVKLGGDALIEGGAASLNAIYNKLDTSKTRQPSFKMVVVADGEFAYRRKTDDVIVCPIGCLCP